MYKLRQLTHKLNKVRRCRSLYIHNFLKTVFNPYNSYSWTSCLFSTLNTIKKIPKDIQYTYVCKLKKIRKMLLTTLENNQHDVI
jgi:hypothetical protein